MTTEQLELVNRIRELLPTVPQRRLAGAIEKGHVCLIPGGHLAIFLSAGLEKIRPSFWAAYHAIRTFDRRHKVV